MSSPQQKSIFITPWHFATNLRLQCPSLAAFAQHLCRVWKAKFVRGSYLMVSAVAFFEVGNVQMEKYAAMQHL